MRKPPGDENGRRNTLGCENIYVNLFMSGDNGSSSLVSIRLRGSPPEIRWNACNFERHSAGRALNHTLVGVVQLRLGANSATSCDTRAKRARSQKHGWLLYLQRIAREGSLAGCSANRKTDKRAKLCAHSQIYRRENSSENSRQNTARYNIDLFFFLHKWRHNPFLSIDRYLRLDIDFENWIASIIPESIVPFPFSRDSQYRGQYFAVKDHKRRQIRANVMLNFHLRTLSLSRTGLGACLSGS